MRRPEPTPERWRRIGELFERARELEPPARGVFLESVGAEDGELRLEIEELLAADGRSLGFLDGDAVALAAPAWAEGEEGGARGDATASEEVGGYRLREEIGRGGMGRVFAAERIDDRLGRRVAIKRFAAAGRQRDELRRRFRAEGRALAALSHANIAQVFDAGVDAAGDPFLVMELIDGVPITEHCAAGRLGVDERIDLFLAVCAAVQHAHQHLIVHRDLKPSNILVDGEGRVKLLDFGIAKLLDPEATAGGEPLAPGGEPPAPTRTGLLPMTPEYAAPEQVRGEPITTATDVYALGLLLYELLTGRRPHDLESRSPAEIERVVCGSQAARPSSVIAASPNGGASPAPPGGDRASLRRRLAGDLDTIVLLALRKEPAARYPSAAALADDLRRHRSGLPVSARPASLTYQVRKFAERHRAAVATAVAALALVLAFGVFALLERRSAVRQRDLARVESQKSEEVVDFLLGLFASSDPSEALGEETTARQLLERGAARVDEMQGQPEVQARMLDVLGTVYSHVGNQERAEQLLRRALEVERQRGREGGLEEATITDHLGQVRMRRGDYEEAEELLRAALAAREARLGPDHPGVAASLASLASALKQKGDPKAAEPLLYRALRILESGGNDEIELAAVAIGLGELLHDLGRYDESERVLTEARERLRRRLGPIHPNIADADNALANLLARRGRFDEAETLLREALAQRLTIYGEEHPVVAQSRNDLAVLLENRGDFAAAAPVYRQALAAYERLSGPDHLAVAIAASNLAGVELLLGNFERSEALYRRGLDIVVRQLGEVNRYAPVRRVGIGLARHGKGDLNAAEASYRRALDIGQEVFAPDHPFFAYAQLELGRLLVDAARADEALPVLTAARDLHERAFGPDHPRTARARAWMGAGIAANGDPREGARLLREALELQRQLLPAGHPHLAESEQALAALGAGD